MSIISWSTILLLRYTDLIAYVQGIKEKRTNQSFYKNKIGTQACLMEQIADFPFTNSITESPRQQRDLQFVGQLTLKIVWFPNLMDYQQLVHTWKFVHQANENADTLKRYLYNCWKRSSSVYVPTFKSHRKEILTGDWLETPNSAKFFFGSTWIRQCISSQRVKPHQHNQSQMRTFNIPQDLDIVGPLHRFKKD